MEEILQRYAETPQIKQLISLLKGEINASPSGRLEGLIGSQDAFVAAAVFKQTNFNHLFILSDKEEAAYFHNNLTNLLKTAVSPLSMGEGLGVRHGNKDVFFFPDSFKRPQDFSELNNNNVLLRTESVNRLSNSTTNKELVVSYPEALLEKVVKAEALNEQTLRLQVNEKLDIDFMIDLLVEFEFERVDFVYEPGQFSIRGDIVDVYSFGNEFPYRVELFGNEIESIRTFDPLTQLSQKRIASVTIVPNIQTHFGNEKKTSVLDVLPANTVIWIKDEQLLKEIFEQAIDKAKKIQPEIRKHKIEHPNHPLIEADAEDVFVKFEEFEKQLSKFKVVHFGRKPAVNSLSFGEGWGEVVFHSRPQPSFNKNFDLLLKNLHDNTEAGYTNLIFAENPKQIERFYAIFEDLEKKSTSSKISNPAVNPSPLGEGVRHGRTDEVTVPPLSEGEGSGVRWSPVHTGIHHGFIDDDLKICFYTDHQIFNRYHKYNLRQGFSKDKAMLMKTLRELKPGDYVTHIDHGVGVFSGLEKIEVAGQMQETVRLIYAGNDILYVGIQSLHKISKYVGKEGESPRVNKLGTDTWNNLKKKTKKRIKELAFDLIQLYAKRKAAKGFQFSPDGYLQNELDASFMYEDTPDQAKATEDVKRDMEATSPMDRLVCGDVGFGKTEVAIRAAFKAATDGKQVAVLAPTTILVMQHAKTFKERLADFPVEIEYINRFKTAKEKKEILQKLAEGKINIIIGTHALLAKNVKFKDLGLMIVDEEQKFGVGAKETLKTIRANVDTLTLTATPIPRTLSFSLMGARDLSIINTPPPNRQPITTEVHPLDPDLIKEAIEYEVYRGGQVFFVHNRVRDIGEVKEMLMKLVPSIDIGVAHGQMEGEHLEEVITKFINREYDVLLCTNIIESGIDIPNANTIIINNAHQFGLSDLHQLRGRVGRSNKHAFCYLFAPPLSTLTNESRQRLKTIEEFSDLGSGFNIAMRDMDIRGAGNMLGAEQSGFIAEIGYDVYQKILDEAIRELKDSEFKELYKEELERTHDYVRDCAIETDLEMLIPNEYVSNTTERMLLYRDLNEIKDEEGLKKFEEQLHDRFGEVPAPVFELFDAMRLKWIATGLGMEQIILKGKTMRCYFVANKESAFYSSSTFGKILQYVQQHRAGVYLRETEKYLVLTFENVKTMKEAEERLEEVGRFGNEK
ncbi:MAG: transcription-repair coupling factor [Chitinophagales bacterium]|nr:transcription-repair coupling factor [Chitinophagales bacterium]